jgi:hypothetical protein
MNQMTYNSPFMNQYGPTPVILSDEEKKRKREAEIAKDKPNTRTRWQDRKVC